MSDGHVVADAPTLAVRVREVATDAIGYWEPRRIAFNLVMAGVVLGYVGAGWPGNRAALSLEVALGVFILAVLANICYCLAYVADIFVQLSGFREAWRRVRWVLFAVGMLVAVIVTRWFAIGLFSGK